MSRAIKKRRCGKCNGEGADLSPDSRTGELAGSDRYCEQCQAGRCASCGCWRDSAEPVCCDAMAEAQQDDARERDRVDGPKWDALP